MSIRATYVGHATVLIELAGVRILTDPVLRPLVFGIVKRAGVPPASIDPPPDAILISHQHPDHLDPPSLRMLGSATPTIAPRGSGRRLRRSGMRAVQELAPGESTRIGEVEIVATPADHDGRRLPIGRRTEALGFELRGGGRRVYFAGDTDLFDEMAALAGVDLAFLPIGGWGPHIGAGHLDPERAARAAAVIRPRAVVPIHWGTMLRADLHRHRPELLHEPAAEFRARMALLAPDVDAQVLEPGESFELAP